MKSEIRASIRSDLEPHVTGLRTLLDFFQVDLGSGKAAALGRIVDKLEKFRDSIPPGQFKQIRGTRSTRAEEMV